MLDMEMVDSTDYRIVTSNSPEGLTSSVKKLISEGWKRVGSHQVVNTFLQDQYSGSQHMRTLYQHEYSQTMVKEV